MIYQGESLQLVNATSSQEGYNLYVNHACLQMLTFSVGLSHFHSLTFGPVYHHWASKAHD